ncbi:MAG: hypothetical protein V1808_00155 [Candidatus Daviesbacteria bacterium]
MAESLTPASAKLVENDQLLPHAAQKLAQFTRLLESELYRKLSETAESCGKLAFGNPKTPYEMAKNIEPYLGKDGMEGLVMAAELQDYSPTDWLNLYQNSDKQKYAKELIKIYDKFYIRDREEHPEGLILAKAGFNTALSLQAKYGFKPERFRLKDIFSLLILDKEDRRDPISTTTKLITCVLQEIRASHTDEECRCLSLLAIPGRVEATMDRNWLRQRVPF